MPPNVGADFRDALVARRFFGALPPVDLRAVCFVRAIELYVLLPRAVYLRNGTTTTDQIAQIEQIDDKWNPLNVGPSDQGQSKKPLRWNH